MKGGITMRHVAYTKKELAHKRGRSIAVRESSADAQSDTRVAKTFVYLLSRVDEVPARLPEPQIRILKKIDTVRNEEKFVFRVKGEIYIKKNRFVFKVRYCHGLNIKINWKTQVLAPDKPAAFA
jgi:hypothetical protein